jgi:transcriptional regulator with XRE-family HTH domain
LRDVAQRCSELGQDVDFSSVSRWERDEWQPRPRMLPVLAKVLDLSVDDLFAPKVDGDPERVA